MIGARRAGYPRGEELALITPSEPDDYGDPTGPDARTTMPGCVVVPGARRELTDGRATTVTTATVYAPLDGPPVRATQVIERADGSRWQVQGEPGEWRSPVSGLGGVEIEIERVSG